MLTIEDAYTPLHKIHELFLSIRFKISSVKLLEILSFLTLLIRRKIYNI